MKNVTVTQLKKHLESKSNKSLCLEIADLFKTFPNVKEYYTLKLKSTGSADLIEKYRKIIKNEFDPDRGHPKLRYSVARKAIEDFKKVCNDPSAIADLMISYVEYGVVCTNTYGDIDEQFYDSLTSMFEKSLKHIGNFNLEKEFQPRCLKITKDGSGIGWGFSDCLDDLYADFYGVPF